MFRFLDKRSTGEPAWISTSGRSRASTSHEPILRATELKRRLKPALEELEQLGFLEPLDAESVIRGLARCWRIILIRSQAADPMSPPPTETSALADALIARG